MRDKYVIIGKGGLEVCVRWTWVCALLCRGNYGREGLFGLLGFRTL